MSLIPIKNELNNLKLKAYKEIDFSENPGYFGSVGGFFRSIATSLRFVLTEKENIGYVNVIVAIQKKLEQIALLAEM